MWSCACFFAASSLKKKQKNRSIWFLEPTLYLTISQRQELGHHDVRNSLSNIFLSL